MSLTERQSNRSGHNSQPSIATSKPNRRDNRVIINVGGTRHETYKTTLKSIPDTRLSWLTETQATNADYDPIMNEYFFDRHPGVFAAVLNYYRTGKLHAPVDVCGPLYEEELNFWGIDEKQIEACCWSNYSTHRDAEETLKEFGENGFENNEDDDDDEDIAAIFGIEEIHAELSCWERWQPKVWELLDEPYSSPAAQFLNFLSLFFIGISIVTYCTETVDGARVWVSTYTYNTTANETYLLGLTSEPHRSLDVIEYICTSYFTVELIVRFIFSPNKCEFTKNALNIVDCLSIMPFYLKLFIKMFKPDVTQKALESLNFFRVVRIFRIFKLTRHLSGLKILFHTIKASLKELFLLILIIVIGILIFASLVYYAERFQNNPDNEFDSIFRGFWWALITMTTIGYGDVVPKTPAGMLVGFTCAISGVLTISLPVPIIVNNFALYYTHAQARLKLPKKKKQVLIQAPDALKQQGIAYDDEESNNSGSLGGSRKSSGSDTDSQDSGIKSSPSDGIAIRSGISVIFTDETNEEATATAKEVAVTTQTKPESALQTVRKATMKCNKVAPEGNEHEECKKKSMSNGEARKFRRSSMGPGNAGDTRGRRRQSLTTMAEVD